MHAAEFDGTAIETSLTATLKVTLHKKGSLPRKLSKLNFPLLENANEYIVHGFNYGVSPFWLQRAKGRVCVACMWSMSSPDTCGHDTCLYCACNICSSCSSHQAISLALGMHVQQLL